MLSYIISYKYRCKTSGLGGAGGGGHSDLLVKLVFEIAVAQQTRTREKTFWGSIGPQPPGGAATPMFGLILAQLCQIT